MKFVNCMIAWKSVLQKIVALSTTEAEYVRLCSGSVECANRGFGRICQPTVEHGLGPHDALYRTAA